MVSALLLGELGCGSFASKNEIQGLIEQGVTLDKD
jgi:hypothetical protein